jgi:hypothetical protein
MDICKNNVGVKLFVSIHRENVVVVGKRKICSVLNE